MPYSTSLPFDFFAPQRISFGWGRRSEAGTLAATFGLRAFVIAGSRTLIKSGRIDEIESALRNHGVVPIRLTVISREPEVTDVDLTVERLLEHRCGPGDLIVGVGGGAAVDLAKAVSAMVTNRESATVKDYLEGVGRGLKIINDPLPVLAIPTTAGTGSEATKNAVVSSYRPAFKKSLRSEKIVPRIVLIDPELAATLPPETIARTGMDAVTQLLESFISRRAKPIPDALCLRGLELALKGLPDACALVEAVENRTLQTAREKMALAALFSGMALANSGLGMAHGVAAALGVHARVAHGLACAVMLPAALEFNQSVCQDRLERVAEICLAPSALSRQSGAARVNAFLDAITHVSERIGIPKRLGELGVSAAQIPDIVTSSRGSSMDGNPRDVSDEQLQEILEQML